MNTNNTPIVTIDGPSGAGKGTIARLVAEQLGYQLLDSGALYRVTALAAQSQGISPEQESEVAAIAAALPVRFGSNASGGEAILLNEQDITADVRTEATGNLASQYAGLSAVRAALLDLQKGFACPPGLVADGRDMGTEVFPQAKHKIFLTASAEERAKRRYNQLRDKGLDVNLSRLIEQVAERDERDANRAVAPLRPAEDAKVIDTTGIDIDSVLAQVLAVIGQ